MGFQKIIYVRKKYNSINANLSYFFNDIPSDIIDSEYITSNKPFSISKYKNDTLTDWDNFDFD